MPPDEPIETPLPLACVITELDPGGAERAFGCVVVGLSTRGWSPRVFVLRRTGGDETLRGELAAAGVPVSRVDSLGLPNLTSFRRQMRRQRPVAVLSFLFHANLLARFAAPFVGAGGRRPAVVCGVRVAERRRNGHRTLDRLTAPLVDRWVCVGESVRRFSVEEVGLPASRVVTIPNGVDVAALADARPASRAALDVPRDAPVLLFAGRLDVQKDPLTLLAAFESLRRPDAHLLIAGDGPLADPVRRWCDTHPAGPRVRRLGRRDDLPALMKLADALVLPSRWEGTPNVVLEAVAAGTPVVATAVDGTAEVLAHGETGRLVPVGDVPALARELAWVLDHPGEAAAMAGRATTRVLPRHDWAAVCDAYDALLRSLIAP